MSWLTPKHVDDVQRILRGVALVVARAATDSRVVRRAAAAEQQRVLQYAADFLAQQQHGTQAAEAAQPEPKRWRPQARSTPILHTLQEPSLEQMAGPAGLQPPSPDPLITQAILASASTSAPPATSPAAPQAAAREGRQQAAVQPALHASPAPVATAAATASTSGPGPAGPAATSPPPQAAAPPADAPAAPLSPPQPSGWASAGTAAGLPPAAANKRPMRERRVPASPMGRALGFAGMGATLMLGTLGDAIGRTVGGIMGPQQGAAAGGSGSGAAAAEGVGGNAYLTAANAERLANALSRMRGAALKIGQMLSIQDESLIPPQVQAALERVRAGADVMPRRQLEGVLVQELGADWRSKLAEFDPEPRAAASIGQVHAALLHDGRRVAMKVQYPGVARGIVSDIDNLMRLIRLADILPKGLYVENAVQVAKKELALECDYSHELAAQQRFRALVAADPELRHVVHVPDVVPELSSSRILTTEWITGVPIDKVRELPQATRDAVGTLLLRITLRELFEWRFMQTDPNWGNFLYDPDAKVLHLIDFGAAREFQAGFVSDYLRMVHACAERDGPTVLEMSRRLGFLTGDEPQVMMDAHVEAGFVVGIPFAAKGAYDFGAHGGMTARVQQLGSVMLKHRLTPPPEEAYSLHRKLSGAFLACMKLRARVPCRELLHQVLQRHQLAAAGGSDQQAAGRMAVSAAPLHDKHDERQERRQSSSESSGRVVAAIIA